MTDAICDRAPGDTRTPAEVPIESSGLLVYTTGLILAVLLTATSFWIEDRIGVVPPVFNLMQFGRYPLTIYDGWIRFTLSFVIPFAFASFYPVMHFLRRGEFAREFWAVPLSRSSAWQSP